MWLLRLSKSECAMKIVGRRKVGLTTPEDADRLLRTAWAVRGTDNLVTKGLYRFRSFEEADEWMRRMMASTYVRLRKSRVERRLPHPTGPE